MIFEIDNYYIDLIRNEDVDDVVDVYNSNNKFLRSHMDKNEISKTWLQEELSEMKKFGFYSCKIAEQNSNRVIGIIDFKIDKESYLSLLMLHKSYKNRGIGKLIYDSFEKYAKIKGSSCIRIDVVTKYDNTVFKFWTQKGFEKYKDIKLNWTGKLIPAVIMKKDL